MIKIKAGRPLVKLSITCYLANLPMLLEGEHGIGKSDILREAANELGINCIVYDLSLSEPSDLIGLPLRKGGKTVYCPPASLPESGKGFLVFEELNRAPRYMLAPTLQLLTARRLNDYLLPKEWLPVAAINPPDGGYDVNELDEALLSRFVKVNVVADRKEWLYWGQHNNVHPDVLAYVQADPSIFDGRDSNPRAWKYVSNFLFANAECADPQIVKAVISGLVGPKWAASFLRYLKDRVRPLSASEIFASYAKHRTRMSEWLSNGRLDLVRGSLRAVKTHLKSRDNFDAVDSDTEQWKNLKHFLKDLPGDLVEEAEQFFTDHDYPFPQTGRASK